jgi:PucR family transcriptional regulator, purine catabolism regulatory protein
MYMTVRDTLAEPTLRELRLIAGASGLDRHVTRVSVLEIPDGLGYWTSGGELFMSTFNSLRGDCEGQIEVVRMLNRNNVAALCLHPGLSKIEFLDELADIAEECGMPLLTMPRDMPYAVVADAVVGGLRGRQAALIQRSAAIHREFIQLTLRGQDLDALCRVFSRRTRRPVAVVGPDGWDVLADGGSIPESPVSIGHLLRHRGTFSHASEAVSVPIHLLLDTGGPDHVLKIDIPTPAGPVTQVAAPVVIGSEIAAYLVTWELGPPLSEFDLSVLAHACTAVGLVVLRRKAVMETELQIQQDFYGAAISGDFRTLEEAKNRATASGVGIPERYVVAVVNANRLTDGGDPFEIRSWGGSTSVAVHSDRALVLHVPDHERDPVGQARSMLERLARRIAPDETAPILGQSDVVSSILDLPQALEHARLALKTGSQLMLAQPVVHYGDLGAYQMLSQVGDARAVDRFTRDTIAKIVAARSGEDLLNTIEAFLDGQGSHQSASERLGVHPNTVKYRISRARDLLGCDVFENPDKRLGLHLAIKAHRILN